MPREPLLRLSPSGLYCEPGDFHVDPWQPVARAVVTHAHADHARPGSRHYLAARPGETLLKQRLGADVPLTTVDYGEPVDLNGVRVSLHPAGHVLGSAQVRVEHRGEVWVVSGDYKREPDPTCAGFELVPCHTFVTESTFGLPIFRWPAPGLVFEQINDWWRANQSAGRASVLFAYALGKAQRVLAGVDASIGPIYTHGAVEVLNRLYRDTGVPLPATTHVGSVQDRIDWSRGLILAPMSAKPTPWMRKFGKLSTAFASGWMAIRGTRRRRAIDRGFVLSDHADWPGLATTIRATGAERVFVTHGYVAPMVRWLREQGLDAHGLATRFEGEPEEFGILDPDGQSAAENHGGLLPVDD